MTQTEEWARGDQIEQMFGLRPSYLRKLALEGKITCKILRAAGSRTKGVRIYLVESVRHLIAEH